jgi:mannosyltransferase
MSASPPDSTGREETPAPAAAGSPAGGRDPWALGLLLAACLLGLLRFWKLGEWSLWIDEAYTFADATFAGRGDQIWNPGGYWLIRWTVELLGGRADEFSLRLLPALVGWLCVPLSWWAFRGQVGDRRAALVALLIAVSSWHIYWSQNARFYTMAMAVSLLGSGLCLRGLWRGHSVTALVGLALTAAAAVFHVTAAVVAPAIVVAPLLARLAGAPLPPKFWRAWRWLACSVVLFGLVASPWLVGALRQHTAQKATFDILRGPAHLMLTAGYFYTPMVGAAAVVGAMWAWRGRDSQGLFAAGVALSGLLVMLLVSTTVLMTAQYTFCLLPWALFVCVAPLEALGRGAAGRALFAAGSVVLATPALASTALYMTERRGERPRWREAYEFVDAQREPGDLILGMGAPIGEFYLGGAQPDPRRTRTISPLGDWFPEGPRRWNRHDRRIWVVVRPQWVPSFRKADVVTLNAWLEGECQLVKSYPVPMEGKDLELRVYLRE